jgi:hypothetical protein
MGDAPFELREQRAGTEERGRKWRSRLVRGGGLTSCRRVVVERDSRPSSLPSTF